MTSQDRDHTSGIGFHLVYTKWANGEPDRRYNIQDCVTIKDDDSGHWEDINCYHHLPFICQKNA